MITLDQKATYRLPIKNGYLDIRASQDPEYPGLDVEYVDDLEDAASSPIPRTRPRVLIECPSETNTLRALIWDDPKSEDYSISTDFSTVSDANLTIVNTCPTCGNSTWVRRDADGAFECGACGDLVFTEDMICEVREDEKNGKTN